MIKTITFPYTRFPAAPSAAFPNRTYIDRPALETTVQFGSKTFPRSFFAIIDSGADSCVFPAAIGRQIGIDIRSGSTESTMGATGAGQTYYHRVKVYIRIQGKLYSFDCYAGFMYELDQFGFGLLGRHGFFSLFESITLDSKNKRVELKFDEP